MSLETVDLDNNDVSTNPNSSAQIYLRKIAEFSHPPDHPENKTIINKAIDFIQEITQADYIIVSSLVNNGSQCVVHGSFGLDNFRESLNDRHANIVKEFTSDRIIFNAKEFHFQQLASCFLPESAIKSGISVPIRADGAPCGCLLIFSKNDQTYSPSKITLLEHVAHLISRYLQQKLFYPFTGQTAHKVVEAKPEWENVIDALPQLVVVINTLGKIVRINQAIEHWGLGAASSQKDKDVINLLTLLCPAPDTVSRWNKSWEELRHRHMIEWEFENHISGMSLRFLLRHLHNNGQHGPDNPQQHYGYAALIVDNITELAQLRKQQLLYAESLKQQLCGKIQQLVELNVRLAEELTQHKRARKALKLSESRYTHLLENTLVGICVLDKGKIEYCNQMFAEIIGMEVKKIHGKQLLRLVDPEYRALLFKQLNSIMSAQADKYLGIIKAINGNNKERWVKIKLNYLSAEEPEKILVNIFDVTAQKEIEISLRESERRLRTLYRRLINAQENERKRVASELHDGLGQMLSSIKYRVENTIKRLDGEQYPAASGIRLDLQTVVVEIKRVVEETRCMAMDLRPPILDDLGIIMTINWFCRQFQQTFKNMKIRQEISVKENDIDEKLKLVIYRIMQESFNNVIKHSGATNLVMKLYKSNHSLHLKIEDDGQGFTIEDRNNRVNTGSGLNSMRERAELTGGFLHIDINKPAGTRINVIWPMAK
ncbi:MAG: PAS domain-containing protein [Gammaproteobacteria bacterium]|nr:PAS domain-containing protein [Gammaproteobacteria bacterium]